MTGAVRAFFNGKTPYMTVCALKTPDSQFLIPVYPFLMFFRTRLVSSLAVDMRISGNYIGEKRVTEEGKKAESNMNYASMKVAD